MTLWGGFVANLTHPKRWNERARANDWDWAILPPLPLRRRLKMAFGFLEVELRERLALLIAPWLAEGDS